MSGPRTHTMEISKNRKKLTCDAHILWFKEMAICCHTIAIAHNEGLLKDFASSYSLSFAQEYLEKLVRRPMSVHLSANDPTIHKEVYQTMVTV